MADINLYAAKLPTWEGGFVNDPLDKGGATNCGVTLTTFQYYRKMHNMAAPTVTDLKNISPEEWLAILKWGFWDRWQADELINQSVAECLVEWFWGSGNEGIKKPQEMLGLVPDDVVGPMTVEAVNAQDQHFFHNRLVAAKISFIQNIVRNDPSQQCFYNDWLRRINAFTFVA
jgi:lysozyme family protein